ncbi:MAG TPA: ankyrin repeat domain-containing protein [Xanthobacteraceae bacterium]|nr:ankyrin repeat domain-containing protein [Xanthobacteraceae bacterium]
MPKALPPHPDIHWLKKAAKERLAALRVHVSETKLHQAQLAVARDYGFASWRALKVHVDARSVDGRIVAATAGGDARALAELLDAHPRKIAITGSSWNRPLLHIAAANGHLDCVNLLLRPGADVNARDRNDNATALHWAAQEGHLDVVERLLAAGADIDGAGDLHEMGVIGWATCFQRVRTEVAELLLARGAKPTIFSAVALGREDLVRALVAADPALLRVQKMSRFEHRRTPLHLAALKNRPAMVELLIALGADPTAKDSRGYTPLNFARTGTHASIVAMLTAAGADPGERHVNRFEHAVPIFATVDLRASIAYYVDKLGFEKKWDYGDPPTFGCVGRDEVEIFLSQEGQVVSPSSLSIFVQDVDALYEDYKKRGAIIRRPPTDYPWGVPRMDVQDLDGHNIGLSGDGGEPNRSDENNP